MNIPVGGLGKPPPSRTCYICGRPYGLSSFSIHEPQCKELFIARQEKLPKNERKPVPRDPLAGVEMVDAQGNYTVSHKELEEINQISTDAWNKETLCECAYCGRTFLPEKLAIHNRSCTAENPAKRAGGPRKSLGESPVAGGGGSTASPATLSSLPSFSPNNKPKTPSRGGRQMSNSADSALNLKISNGQMINQGFSSTTGKQLPNIKSAQAASSQGGGGGGGGGARITAADFGDKAELIDFLANRVDVMEATAAQLVSDAAEIKELLNSLR